VAALGFAGVGSYDGGPAGSRSLCCERDRENCGDIKTSFCLRLRFHAAHSGTYIASRWQAQHNGHLGRQIENVRPLDVVNADEGVTKSRTSGFLAGCRHCSSGCQCRQRRRSFLLFGLKRSVGILADQRAAGRDCSPDLWPLPPTLRKRGCPPYP
jgi:hypothetical protein